MQTNQAQSTTLKQQDWDRLSLYMPPRSAAYRQAFGGSPSETASQRVTRERGRDGWKWDARNRYWINGTKVMGDDTYRHDIEQTA